MNDMPELLIPVTRLALSVAWIRRDPQWLEIADELATKLADQIGVGELGDGCVDPDTYRQVIAAERAKVAAAAELDRAARAAFEARMAEIRRQQPPVGKGVPAGPGGALADMLESEPGPQYTQQRPQSQKTGQTPMQLLQAKAAKQQ
jgi:hypothetical protein